MNDPVILSRGQPYPLQYPQQDGAVADFLRSSGNRLLVMLSRMTSAEEQAFRNGLITGGFLYQNGALLWLFIFYGKDGRRLFTFDAPFDARVIPADDRQLYSIDNPDQRLVIELHAVDDKGILRALRALTLSPALTLSFLSAVQDQLATTEGDRQLAIWMQQQPEQLANTIKLEALGR
jgi:hypothetical protein